MSIVFHEQTKTFHLFNDNISYIMNVLPTGHLMQLYCGKKVHDRNDFSYLIETSARPTTTYLSEEWHNKYTFAIFPISAINRTVSVPVNRNLQVFRQHIQKIMTKRKH